MNQVFRRAMSDPDRYVVELDYRDAKGVASHRVISPIRFLGGYRVLALCLSREAPRQFDLRRCGNVALRRAEQFMMPYCPPQPVAAGCWKS